MGSALTILFDFSSFSNFSFSMMTAGVVATVFQFAQFLPERVGGPGVVQPGIEPGRFAAKQPVRAAGA